jgi:hypothetical protein
MTTFVVTSCLTSSSSSSSSFIYLFIFFPKLFLAITHLICLFCPYACVYLTQTRP